MCFKLKLGFEIGISILYCATTTTTTTTTNTNTTTTTTTTTNNWCLMTWPSDEQEMQKINGTAWTQFFLRGHP